MTDNDLKIRARLAYGNTGFTKQASPEEDAEKEKVRRNHYEATQRGALRANMTKALDAADAAGQKEMDDLQGQQLERDMTSWANHHRDVNDAKDGALAQERKTLDTVNEMSNAQVTNAGDEARKNLYYGIGSGALGGAAVGGISYALGGLFPSLRKRRLLRALLALGVGTGAGVGIGYGVNAGLTSGKLQGALADAGRRASGAWDATKSGVANAIGKIKG